MSGSPLIIGANAEALGAITTPELHPISGCHLTQPPLRGSPVYMAPEAARGDFAINEKHGKAITSVRMLGFDPRRDLLGCSKFFLYIYIRLAGREVAREDLVHLSGDLLDVRSHERAFRGSASSGALPPGPEPRVRTVWAEKVVANWSALSEKFEQTKAASSCEAIK
jgi:hypothetical protein